MRCRSVCGGVMHGVRVGEEWWMRREEWLTDGEER